MSESETHGAASRLSTGVPGLDEVLCGGLLQRAVYIVQGRPGCGKTILANQIAFHRAQRGEKVLYTTLLAETHERLLDYVARLDFFEADRVAKQIAYVSGFPVLSEGGLKAFAELLRREARAREATLVVVDGVVTAQDHAASHEEFKRFIQELQIQASLVNCTVLLLATAGSDAVRPEHTMVDGVLELSDQRVNRRSEREVEVKKFRGSDSLRGGHAFHITRGGLRIYPRLEALLQEPAAEDDGSAARVSTGIVDLDRALGGGLRYGSSTVLFGPTGVGKTTVGLHFLSASTADEPGVHFGFYEPPQRLLRKANALGLELQPKHDAGVVHLTWQPPTERLLDQLGHRLLEAIAQHGAKRLFIDGIDGFVQSAAYPERTSHFFSALTNELRTRGVTTLFTAELRDLFSTEVQLPMEGISSLVENVLLLRFMERRAQLARLLTIVKTRDSDYDPSLRELVIRAHGTHLSGPVESGYGMTARRAASPPRSPRDRLLALLRKRGR